MERQPLYYIDLYPFTRVIHWILFQDSKISPELFGELIYNEYLFDIPRLLDMCSVYGESDATILTKMIHNVFKAQPKYWSDLRRALDGVIEVLICVS